MKKYNLSLKSFPGVFLLGCVFASLYFFFKILAPFATVLFLAAVLTITFYPLYKWLTAKFGGRKRLASLLSASFVMMFIVVPMILVAGMLIGEAESTYDVLRQKVELGVFDKYLLWEPGGVIYDFVASVAERFDAFIDIEAINLKETILNSVFTVTEFIGNNFSGILSGVTDFLLAFILLPFCMFYFFKDGVKILKKIALISPLPEAYEENLWGKLSSMVKSIAVGVLLTAIVQGIAGGIGFLLAGIPNPIFWSTIMAVFSLVPLVGTAIIWVPAAIILIVMGSYGWGIFLIVWGVVVVGSIDNFLRPFLIGGKSNTYPLLTFFAILGGIAAYGVQGVLIGPLVLVVLMSFLHIYEDEYDKVLHR
jgi:predicted PurR-regulated permease PerM